MADEPHEIVWKLSTAVVASRALQVVADLGIADHVDGQVSPVEELAAACGVHAASLDRVLRLLAAHGVFEHRENGYAHNDASRLLRRDHPMSMKAFPQMMGLPVMFGSFVQLERSVRTGAPALERIAPDGLWSYLHSHPDEAAVFDAAMTAKAAADIAAVVGDYDFARFSTIADIGGGRGHLLQAILGAAPAGQGILFELPAVADTLDIDSDRIAVHVGDFFVDPLPAADAYILMEVIHDWADADACAILQAIRAAASPGATVLIIEGVVPEDRVDPRVHTLDVIMLAVTGGQERTASELRQLLDKSGFELSRVHDTAGTLRIVEAVAA